MKYSKQRQLIKEYVIANEIHPTADDVYNALKEENPNLSLGTVYRNLNLLSDMGELLRLHIPNFSDRYDGRIVSHYHVICNKCGKIHDVDISFPESIDLEIQRKTGISVTGHQLIFSGLCKDCEIDIESEDLS